MRSIQTTLIVSWSTCEHATRIKSLCHYVISCVPNFEARLLPANAPDSKWNIDNLPQSQKWWIWNVNIFSFEYWRYACILCCIRLNLHIFSICGMYIFRSKIWNNWYELIPFKLDFLDGLVEVLSTKLSL